MLQQQWHADSSTLEHRARCMVEANPAAALSPRASKSRGVHKAWEVRQGIETQNQAIKAGRADARAQVQLAADIRELQVRARPPLCLSAFLPL